MRTSLPALTIAVSASFPVIVDINNNIFSPGCFSGDIALGSLSAKTKERVYDPDSGRRKNSWLNWKYNNAAIVKGSLDWDLIPWPSIDALTGQLLLAVVVIWTILTSWMKVITHGQIRADILTHV